MKLASCLLLLLVVVGSTPADMSPPPETEETRRLLDAAEERLHNLDRALLEALWITYSTGDAGDLVSREAARSDYLCDPALNHQVSMWLGQVTDPVLQRRVQLLHREVLKARIEGIKEVYQLQDSLAHVQVNWRAVFEGRRVSDGELARILRVDANRDRRKAAFEARAKVGEAVGPGLRELMTLRTRAARELGWRGFYELRLGLEELDAEEFGKTLRYLDELSREPYRKFLGEVRRRLGVPEVEAWDLLYDPSGVLLELEAYFPADSLQPRASRTLRGLGFIVEDLPIHMDLDAREGKAEHAFCFPVDPPGDVRLLQTAQDGINSASTFLHEMGHALHAVSIRQDSWILRNGPSGPFNEGMGEFFGQLAYDDQWLTKVAGVPVDLAGRFLAMRREQTLFTVRWYLALLDFERQAYDDPHLDFSELYWRMLNWYLMVPSHPEIKVWAQVPHLVTHPVYVQNYLLADLIAAQLRAHLRNVHGGILGHAETSLYMETELFRPGAILPTKELLLGATGSELNARFFAEEFFWRSSPVDAAPEFPGR
jgi:peptidyl-dipeptidase A